MKKYIFLLFTLLLFIAGCGEEETNESNKENGSESDVSLQMRNIDVQVEDLEVKVNAEVNSSENTVYYKIEQAEEIIQMEQPIEINAQGNWSEIHIDYVLEEEMLNKENPPVIHLYVKDNQNIVNSNFIPIDVE